MFRIGEFSKLTSVSIRMLRYYDAHGLLRPAALDPASGYRLYTAAQVVELQRILRLRDLGFGVRQMGELLAHWDEARVLEALEERGRAIRREIAGEQERLRRLERMAADLRAGAAEPVAGAVLRSIPAADVASLRRVLPDPFDEHLLWEEMARVAGERKWPIFGAGGFTIYHDAEFRERDVDVEICVVTAFRGEDTGEIRFRRLPEVEYAVSAMVAGPYENINPGYRALAQWLEQHGEYEMLGTSRANPLRGPWNEADPAGYLTEILIPVRMQDGGEARAESPGLDSDTV